MIAHTHVAFSVLVGSAVGITSPHYLPLILGALFPDIDHPNSKLGRIIPLSLIVEHRTITHSLLALCIALYFNIWFGIGYATHLFLDALTPAKIPIFYPYKKRIGIGMIKTSGLGELILLLFFVFTLFLFKL